MTITLTAPLVTFGDLILRQIPGKRLAITTDRSDALQLAVPDGTTEAEVRAFLSRHYGAPAGWLFRGEVARGFVPPAKQLVGGEGFLLDGRSNRFRWQAPGAPHAAAFEPTEHGVWLHLDPALRDDPDRARQAIIDCYSRASIDRARDVFAKWGPRAGLPALATVRITDGDKPWIGLRVTAKGTTVTAHWALAQFSYSTANYLMARLYHARTGQNPEAMFVNGYARRQLHDEARNVWTGDIAPSQIGA